MVFSKKFRTIRGFVKISSDHQKRINKIFADTAEKYNKEKELKIPIKRRKVISKK